MAKKPWRRRRVQPTEGPLSMPVSADELLHLLAAGLAEPYVSPTANPYRWSFGRMPGQTFRRLAPPLVSDARSSPPPAR